MSNEPSLFSRREVFWGTLSASLVSLVESTKGVQSFGELPASDAEYVPENDYPYFDFDPKDLPFLED